MGMKQLRCINVKAKLKIIWLSFVRLFRDYVDHSSIHGVSYIGEEGRSCFEKIWWIVSICVSMLFCAKFIYDAWYIDPIIISFKSSSTPIWQIPFPAVSICPNVLTHYKHINLTQSVYRQCSGPADRKRIEVLNAVSMMCPELTIYKNSNNDPTCNGCQETLREMRIPSEDLFVECKFQNRTIDCMESFKETVAPKALCYTFNGFENYRSNETEADALSNEWSIDEGYKSPETLNMFPRRALSGGSQFGLTILLRLSKHDYEYKCTRNPGFYLEYQMPNEVPELKSKSLEISMGFSYTINLTPKVMTTSKDLQNYPVSERNCLFSDEHRLKYFNQYTSSNCEIECEVDVILENCGCLPIYIENRGNFDTCGYGKRKCLNRYRDALTEKNHISCKCLPACSTMTYDSELSMTEMNMSASSKYQDIYEKHYMYSQLTIYFKENQFMTSKRRELYGSTDFLASCGGLLGLFLGVSAISLLEIAFFCTIRLCCSLKNRVDVNVLSSTDFTKREDRDRTFLKIVKQLINDYSMKTTIQGISYASDTNLSLFERCWWTIVVVMSVLCCGSLIFDVVRHYDQSPIIVSYANEEMPITEIPFPAVTICPQVVGQLVYEWYDRLKFRNMSLYGFIPQLQEIVTTLAQVCDPEMFADVDPENRTNCEKCVYLFHYMMLSVDDLMIFCQYKTKIRKCAKIFKDVITEAGNCYTFNGFHVYRKQNGKPFNDTKEWSLDDGYRNGTGRASVFPRPGTRAGLIINMEVEKSMIEGFCKGPIQGFKVYVHLPNESPLITKHSYLVPYQRLVQFLINPKVITTTPTIRDFPVSKRQCYFSNERYLRFFKHYTQNNCEAECVANLTLKHCNCLRFHIPKVPGVKMCGISDIKCYQQVIQQSIEGNIDQSRSSECNCLPTCNSISYDIEVSQMIMSEEALKYEVDNSRALIRHKCVPRPKKGYVDPNSNFNYLDYYSAAEFFIAFKENQFVAMQRSQLYGPTELFSNFGGLLGLFLGFSLMSVLELIYFCTIRLFCSLKLQLFVRAIKQ